MPAWIRIVDILTALFCLLWSGFAVAGSAVDNPAKPRLMVQSGHTESIRSVVFSADGRYVLSGGKNDNTLKLWDVSAGRLIRTFAGHGYRDDILSVAISQDGKYVLSGSDNNIKLWDASSGNLLYTIPCHEAKVNVVTFSPDNLHFVTGAGDGSIKLWDIHAGHIRDYDGHRSGVNSVRFSYDGARIVSCGTDSTIKIWNVESGKLIRPLANGHGLGGINYVEFSTDGKQVISAGTDRIIQYWDAESGVVLKTFRGHASKVRSAHFVKGSSSIVSLGGDGSVKLWDVSTAKIIKEISTDSLGISAIAVSPDGMFILSGGKDCSLKLWDIVTGNIITRIDSGIKWAMSNSISSDGRYLLTGDENCKLNIWDLSAGIVSRTMSGHKNAVMSVSLSPNGKHALSSSKDGTFNLWDITSGSVIKKFSKQSDWGYSAVFSPNGKLCLTTSGDGSAVLWDVATGAKLNALVGHFDSVTSSIFSPDSRQVITGSKDNSVKMWDVSSGKEIRSFSGHTNWVWSVAITPDGNYLVSGSKDNSVIIWDVTSGKQIAKLAGHKEEVNSVAISPDGRTVISASDDETIRQWAIPSGHLIKTYKGHIGLIRSINYSPDGRFIFSSSADGSTMVWSISDGRWVAKLVSFSDGSWAVVDPAGRYDASNGGKVDGLHWVMGNVPIDLFQLKDHYYEPALLAKIMGFNKEPVRKVEDFIFDLYPEVTGIQLSSDKKKATLTLKNQGGGIGKVRVLINGKELLADARGPKPDSSAENTTITVNVPQTGLIHGEENIIDVMTWNPKGTLSSRGRALRVRIDAMSKTEAGKNIYAVIAGVSNYSDAKMNLNFSGKDAADMARAIKVSAKRLFGADKVHIALLSDYPGADGAQLPTKENLKMAFEKAREARPTDVFLVYFSGHGVMSPGEDSDYYYLTKDAWTTNLADENIRKVSGVSSAELTEWIKQIPATKYQAIILDTCSAGGAAKKLTEGRALTRDQILAFERMKDRTGFFVLMGSTADAVSYEASQYGQGLLTYALLEGISGMALRDEKYVDVQTLFRYASDRVPNLAKSVGGIQRPEIKAPSASSFDIGVLEAEDKKNIPMAMERPRILRSYFEAEDEPTDVLDLSRLVKTRLRDSMAVSRGGEELVYVDSDDLPGAYSIRGRYTVIGEKVEVKVYINEEKKVHRKFTLHGSTGNIMELAEDIVKKTVVELGGK